MDKPIDQLTHLELERLVDVITDTCGRSLTREAFANHFLELMEDVPLRIPLGSLEEIELVDRAYRIYSHNSKQE